MGIEVTQTAWAYLMIAALTWFVTFCILAIGTFLKHKILAWDEMWRQDVEAGGRPLKEYAEDFQDSFERIRGTSRVLAFILVVLLILMGFCLVLTFQNPPFMGMSTAANALWLLALVALAVVLPAYVCFSVGRSLSETMLLKANIFLHADAKQEMREKVARIRAMEFAKKIRQDRAAAQAALAASKGAAPAAPAAAAPPAAKKK
jgi:multidrug efflux pump subunit AcrB